MVPDVVEGERQVGERRLRDGESVRQRANIGPKLVVVCMDDDSITRRKGGKDKGRAGMTKVQCVQGAGEEKGGRENGQSGL